MTRIKQAFTLLLLVALLIGACRPVVAQEETPGEPPTAEVVTETEANQTHERPCPAFLTGNFDFTAPEQGLQHGWIQFDVVLPETADQPPTGWMRWVEVNEALAVRYVIAEPLCVALSDDGQSALLTVQITDRWGWGEGNPGERITFWFNDTTNKFAALAWPPRDEAHGCVYALPSEATPATAGNIIIGGAGGSIYQTFTPVGASTSSGDTWLILRCCRNDDPDWPSCIEEVVR